MSRRLASRPPELPGYGYVKLLGSGGFSDVFLYDQRLPRRKVAVKVLLTEQLGPQTRSQFVDEANVMAQLSAHPYIVTIFHADVASDDRPYFVMEYCSGQSLAERYKSSPFSVEDALRTGVRLSSAIATAHAAGILHRDIKPANVLTNDFGWPALTDFGISSSLEDELPVLTTTTARRRAASARARNDTGTSEPQSIGMSVPWSPPEMFEDDPEPDVRSDVFSLAATLHTLLAGRTPFEVPGRPNGTLDLIGRIERGAVTPLDRPDVPRSLVAVLQKGMAAARTDRFDSAVDFARALQRVELELRYTPTNIEVPNLIVERVERAEEAAGQDETRVRSVATVIAQPPPTAAAAPIEVPVRGVEPTRMRGAIPQVAQGTPVTEPEHTIMRPKGAGAVKPQATEPEAGRSSSPEGESRLGEVRARRKPKRLLTILVACAVIVGGGVTAAVLVPRTSGTTHTGSDGPANGGGGIDVSVVPEAKAGTVTRSADGTSATFSWSNPKPKADDTYEWRQDGTTTGPTQTTETHAVVSGLAPNSAVCIEVVIIRNGRTSPNPTKVCTP